MTTPAIIFSVVAGVFLLTAAGKILASYRRLRRAEFIRHYPWPPGLLDKLKAQHPSFTRKETALVSEGLRQFFLAYLSSGRREVAMPSQVADDLWHEFILYTRDYGRFCGAAFGRFLHHTPAVVLREGRSATTRPCAASGGIAARTRTSTRSGRADCRCCSRSTPN